MKGVVVFFLTVILCTSVLSAQSSSGKSHQIGMGTGYARYQIKDDLESPLTYRGWGVPFQLSYRYRGIQNVHDVFLSFGKSELQSSVSHWPFYHKIDQFRASLKYRYFRLISRMMKGNGRFYLGGIWNTHVNTRNHFYSEDFDETYTEFISSIDVSSLFELDIRGPHSVFAQLALPTVALWVRESYSIKGPLSIQLTSLHRFVRFMGRFGFELYSSNRYNMRFTYDFMYYHYTEPRKTRTGVDRFDVTLVIKF